MSFSTIWHDGCGHLYSFLYVLYVLLLMCVFVCVLALAPSSLMFGLPSCYLPHLCLRSLLLSSFYDCDVCVMQDQVVILTNSY